MRQGDPLSLYLFTVVVETLTIAITQNTAIKGISIGKEDTKLLQYPDDMTAVLSDRDSVYALFNLLDVSRKLSGLKINTSKTEGMWVGSLTNNTSKPLILNGAANQSEPLGFIISTILNYCTKRILSRDWTASNNL